MRIGLFEIKGNGAGLCFHCSGEFNSGYLIGTETVEDWKRTHFPIGHLIPFCKDCIWEFVCHDCLHKLVKFMVIADGTEISVGVPKGSENDIPKIAEGVAILAV